MLIDQIELTNPSLSAALDIAGKSKLFSLVVESTETAQKVLEENKKIKGAVIQIFPLDSVSSLPALPCSYPESSDVRPLIEFIRLRSGSDERAQSILQSVFGKVVLVKDYDTAFQVAKEHGLTCITPDLQAVYGGGFVTKVGSHGRAATNRCALYE